MIQAQPGPRNLQLPQKGRHINFPPMEKTGWRTHTQNKSPSRFWLFSSVAQGAPPLIRMFPSWPKEALSRWVLRSAPLVAVQGGEAAGKF